MSHAAPASVANDSPYVVRADEQGVTTLRLNRPAQFNPLSKAMIAALQAELDSIAKDISVRVVVLAAEGRAFSGGHDLKEMRANASREFLDALFADCAKLMTSIISLPQPVIARVQGIATAAGCQLVASCDLAVSADTAKFAVSGINVGLFCSTPAVALSRNLGRKQAMEMLLTGEMIDAQTAHTRGLLNRVVPADQLDTEIAKLTSAMCKKPAASLALGKQMFYRQLEMGFQAAYQYAGEVMCSNALSDDALEGMDAFIEKRPPSWAGH